MRFGMPTLLECETPADNAALAHQLGLDFVELNMNCPQYQTDAMEPAALRALGRRWGVGFTLHLHEAFSPAAFDPNVRRAWLETARAAVRTAGETEMPIINLHLDKGVWFTLPEQKVFLFDRYQDRFYAGLEYFRREMTAAVGGSGIQICVENTEGFAPYEQRAVELLLESPVFGLTLDVGHELAAGGADTAFYAAHRQRLKHMHLHDARPDGAHLPLGSGQVALADRLALARTQNCRCVVEVKTALALTQSVGWLRQQGAL